jgi:hypothetical protein
MPYRNFKTLPVALDAFKLELTRHSLFPNVVPVAVPSVLQSTLEMGANLAFPGGSEKARSEFVVAPLLLAVRDILANQITIHSGSRFDVDPSQNLHGECDFLITKNSIAFPVFVNNPVLSVVEAKKQDIELGLGQCVAQMVAVQRFNLKHENNIPRIYGCVTTGEVWQFLELEKNVLVLDTDQYFYNELERILGVFKTMLSAFL